MKKILILIVLSFILTGCGVSIVYRLGYYPYIIDDVKYVTGFYDDLYTNSHEGCFLGDLYETSDDIWGLPTIKINNKKAIELNHPHYKMYSILVNSWEYKLFVDENDFANATHYYRDMYRFRYYIARGTTTTYNKVLEIDKIDKFSLMLEGLKFYKYEEELTIDSKQEEAYFFYKISTDGLLTSKREEYYIIDNHVYKFLYMKDDMYHYGKLDYDTSLYFLVLIRTNYLHK